MATIATQVFNEIEHLLQTNNEDLQKFHETWKAVAYIGNERQWHMGWQCLPLGIELTLLHCPSDDDPGVLKHGEGWQDRDPIEGVTPYTYLNMASFIEIATKQSKSIIGYKSDLYYDFLTLLPGNDADTKAYYLGKMFTGNILGSTIGTGSYSSKHEKWDEYENDFSFFLTNIDSPKTNNLTMIMGSLEFEGKLSENGRQYPFAFFTNNCDENRFCPGIVYTKI